LYNEYNFCDLFNRAWFDYGTNETNSIKPYDVAILFDLLDHIDNPIDLLKKVKSELKDTGSVFVRCHPWCSRDAMHLYASVNKAYLHFLFTEEELDSLALYGKKSNPETLDPLPVYRKWFGKVGFDILYEEPIEYPLEVGFSKPFIKSFFNVDNISPIQFVDFILCPSK
jgi:hypothetical protein